MTPRSWRAALLAALFSLVLALITVALTGSTPAVALTQTVSVSADTYTRYDAPTRNFGTTPRISADASSGRARHGFLRFVVPAPAAGTAITSATLRMYADSTSTGRGIDVYSTSNTWTETGLTWATEPARGTLRATAGGYAKGTWVSWNVTAAVPAGGGTVSLELQTTESLWLGFEARENRSGRAPQLVTGTSSTSPTATASPSPTPTGGCNPSGQAMPTTDPAGWTRVFADDFLTNVPVGQFPGTAYGTTWGAYRDGWTDTTGHGTYMPSKVLSVQDCALDYYLHTENGVHMVSAPTPKIVAGAYGRYDVRFRADALHGYKTAWLLWPDSESWPADGEIDWPEGNLDGAMSAYMHFADPNGGQNAFNTAATYGTWHTASTVWQAGKVTFALDGQVFGTSTTKVPSTPMHWVLQTETSTDGTTPADATSGHVKIDWVVAWKASSPTPTPTPTTTPPPAGDIVLAAVGDLNPPGVTSTTSNGGNTASSIAAANPTAVALLGDLQYQYGDCGSLVGYLDKIGWGGLWSKVIATAGPTHDWSSITDTANYRNHMAGTCSGQTSGRSLASTATGTNVGPDSNYVVDLGAWRVYSLSSGLWRYDTTKAVAATTWLSNALAAGQAAGDHAVVIWHEPYWTSPTSEHASATTAVRPWIDLLNSYDVKLVLSGHQHLYERFHPQDAPATRNDATGAQQFIVGTGGIGFYCPTSTAANSAARQCNAFGWLKLTLHADGHYAWQFVRTGGSSYSDEGSR